MKGSRQLVYWSGTGVTRRIADKFGGIPIQDYDAYTPCILMFPSYGSPKTGGYIPPLVAMFLEKYHENVTGIVGVGNTTFGADFCKGSRLASEQYGIPTLAEIDMVLARQQRAVIEGELA